MPRAWTPVFCVLSFDNWLHGFAGRTEGAVAVEDAAFSLDLALASAVVDDAESATVTVTLRPGSVSSMLGLKAGRVVQLRARDGADAVEWARAIRRPLTLGGFVAADRADVLCNASPDAAPPTGPIAFL